MLKRLLRGAGACSMLALTSCLAPSSDSDRQGEPGAAKEGQHWIQDARLRAIMTDLDTEVATSWPQEIEDEYTAADSSPQAAKALEEACWLAEGLAKTATRIPDTVARLKVPEVDRRSFLAQADTLRDQAQRLGRLAGSADVAGMRAMLAEINDTCQSCHRRFRDFSGPLHHHPSTR